MLQARYDWHIVTFQDSWATSLTRLSFCDALDAARAEVTKTRLKVYLMREHGPWYLITRDTWPNPVRVGLTMNPSERPDYGTI